MSNRESRAEQEGELLVVKIGGSTLGSHDTALEDLVALQRRGLRPVVVHGGGAQISDWLKRLNVPTRFERGLRVTDEVSLQVVVSVLAGLVNKQLVAQLQALGGTAVGLSGADGGMLQCRLSEEKLGFVGEIIAVDPGSLARVLLAGSIPVIAPIGLLFGDEKPTGQLLNINADTAAGALAAALGARWLVFLTDVAGVRSDGGQTPAQLSAAEARRLIGGGVIEGGMIPKVEACLQAAAAGATSVVADGREAHRLLDVVAGKPAGTVVA
ncbi:MAG: acetylglutamate kinase [Dehalococcoidia bacterium]|nr:acetylglutamate kinase [Dehalococcoidia bacterium]